MMKKSTVIKIAAAALLVAGIGGVSAYAMNMGTGYTAAYVSRKTISGSVKESGTIHGKEDKVYYAAVTAPVDKVNIKLGERVDKGYRLLSYDETELKRSTDEAAIKSEQAQLSLDGQLSSSDKYASKYNKAASDDEAYAALYWLYREQGDDITEEQFARSYEIQCQIDAVSKQIAEKKKEIAERTHDYNDANDYGTTPSSELSEGDRDDMKDALEEIDSLNAQLEELSKGLAITSQGNMTPYENEALNDTNNVLEDIARNWTEAKSNKAEYEGNILNEDEKEALKKNIELSEEEEARTLEKLTKAHEGITAGFSGVVTSLKVHDGAYVAEGTELFTIENSESLVCRVNLSKYDIVGVKPGQRAVIDVAGKQYEGEVSKTGAYATSDSSDKNRVEVEVSLKDADEAAIVGIEADVTIYTDTNEGALVIPVEAFYSDDDGDYCYTIEEGKIVKRYVSAGIENGEEVEILDGLAEGSVVVTDAVTDDNVGDKAKYVIP